MSPQSQPTSNLWLAFALATVLAWGLYGFLLHLGQLGMADPDNGRIKAFLCVGVAYVLVAVLVPVGILISKQASWVYPTQGLVLSTLAGVAGAVGALFVLLSFGAKGNPAVVMSIVFAGAPVVNAVVALLYHPPEGGWSALRWQFIAGIVLAAVGGLLVMRYRPATAPAPSPSAAAPQATAR
jgi:uncharacterized membrane protein YeaQ/YmgE (transglycosylase-associated protein family)